MDAQALLWRRLVVGALRLHPLDVGVRWRRLASRLVFGAPPKRQRRRNGTRAHALSDYRRARLQCMYHMAAPPPEELPLPKFLI